VLRNPWSRIAWMRDGRRARLFVGGECHACSRAFAQCLCNSRRLRGSDIAAVATRADLDVLAALVDSGHLVLQARSRKRR
jgi:50S ribosomal protein L16 3-hydroxylase